MYICNEIQAQTPMEKKVFLVAKGAENGYEYFGIFSNHELAEKEAEKHYGAFIVMVKMDQPVMF